MMRSFQCGVGLTLFLVELFVCCCYVDSLVVNSSNSNNCLEERQTSTNLCGSRSSSIEEDLGLDIPRMVTTIGHGRAYQQSNFLSEDEVQWLVSDMEQIKECFQPSGLSDLSRKQQGFTTQKDRSTCPAPWWTDESTASSPPTLQNIRQRIDSLRTLLSRELQRPTMMGWFPEEIAHECYYSQSHPGAVLPLHMDERHEEMKGSRGWLLPSRRSISWLIYLSDDPHWSLSTNGGALRTYPQPHNLSSPAGSHNGNLQIGYLTSSSPSSSPVYLDCWFPISTQDGEIEPHSVLYIVDEKDDGKLMYITRPWNSHEEQGAMLLADFLKQMSATTSSTNTLFLDSIYARSFQLLEDREAWSHGNFGTSSIEDVVPQRGSLVMFDSVALPHEVLEVKRGTRAALAGWFHEQTQPFPENIYNHEEL